MGFQLELIHKMQCGVWDGHREQQPDKLSVPKLIMQTWKSESMNDTWRQGQQSIMKHMPDWQYVFLTDEAMYAFVKDSYPDLYERFCSLRYSIQRADVLRYLWLYKYGGLYIDLDYEVMRSFDSLLAAARAPLYVLYSANVRSVLTNSLIMAIPGLTLFYTLAQQALFGKAPMWAFSRHVYVMSTTGPLAFHSAVVGSGVPYTVLPHKLFLQGSPVLHDIASVRARATAHSEQLRETAYTVPLDGGSWNSTDTTIINFLNKHKWTLVTLASLGVAWFLLHGAHSHMVLRSLQGHLRRALRLRRLTNGLLNTLDA